MSTTGIKSGIFTTDISSTNDMGNVLQSNNIYNRSDIQWYTKFNRFGCIDPYNGITNTKEYLFFVKPDLHICEPGTTTLNPELSNYPYFNDLIARYPEVVSQLQRSMYPKKTSNYYPFMNVLSNSVKNTLDLQAVTTTEIDTPTNVMGTSITYRGSGYSSDENFEFSLEFEDTKYLEIYQLVKAYEEYERLKRLGIVTPPNIDKAPVYNGYNFNTYIKNKRLHDQFGIYKFIMDEDYETIIYYAYITGVFFKNVPRDSFTDLKESGGLRYSLEFKAFHVDDLNPEILYKFNSLISDSMNIENMSELPIYNHNRNIVDGRWAKIPWVVRKQKSDYNPGVWLGPNSMQYDYKLQWKI